MDINNVGATRADINEMLSKIRELSNKSKIFSETNKVAEKGGFDEILSTVKNAISQVNQTQTEAEKMKSAYVAGDSQVSLSQLIVASQKSKLAFEGLLTVRNKILEAYKEIMNMPV
ncbi:flagellar hook-basal body complex protein FliE [Aquicella lusitana]|uniref:Flagellar hook-basal body complex protein FliE n=1 Tax=Aquicella lusitana TaxID=254246 RepID=A0A370G415_9COXI|nr:flagellar hook-basal body complex protein FliE [Aquicella lusitana]RDI38528.1 flagellar hook-basal body complex protein FliE [Aquicella lusitana]VVC74627.1 Flagellar hook-basal body complex protein FliE [Aquicella lusitana]